MTMKTIRLFLCLSAVAVALSCGPGKKTVQTTDEPIAVGPTFNADSAYRYCAEQCAFGPRTMNSEAHDRCGRWIADKFKEFGFGVVEQKTTLTGYDGTRLSATNIIASHKPELDDRVLVCAHWDSRPWADNDPDEANWRKPVMAANDGASGVAVMLELARLIQQADSIGVGIDFICFDAEDWGLPQWSEEETDGSSWALGSAYWAKNLHKAGYRARFGILLDMVGGQGAQFYQEGVSLRYARSVVDMVWKAARAVGYGSYFPLQEGGMITDDHVNINQWANIPTIDIIPYYPDCPQSSFGPTWHTVNDDMDHIDKGTLQAVGQTLVQVIYSL